MEEDISWFGLHLAFIVYGFQNKGAVIALYNALIRSHLECNASVWAPREIKYTLLFEQTHNKFIRYLYLKQYGVYPFYPSKYPTLFLGMVEYNELRVRRQLAPAVYMFWHFRGKINSPELLRMIYFNVPYRNAETRRRPGLLVKPRVRTTLLREVSLTQAICLPNQLSDSEFTRAALFVICYV